MGGSRRLLARLAVQPGLCAGCVHLRLLASPRSVFVRCGLADSDPAFPRYPALPVLRCGGFRPPAASAELAEPAKDNARDDANQGGDPE
jgi:hypothetical protein